MLFFDFEVFKNDWLVVILDMVKKQECVIVNDSMRLRDFYEQHKNDIWVGYNVRHYDQYTLKGILAGLNPKDINDWIIKQNQPGWTFSNDFKKHPLLYYDVYTTRTERGLKYWEASLGHSIKESSVPFDLKRKLTNLEIEETIKYCRHDVIETVEVFLQKKNDFLAILGLIKMFPDSLSIRDIGLTKAQIVAKILECEKVDRYDEFDLFVLPCIKIEKYKKAIDFYLQFRGGNDSAYKEKLNLNIAGLNHTIGWGGIHAGGLFLAAKEKQIFHIDVASFYPRLMIFHNLLTRNCRKPERFKLIYERRIDLKKAGMKGEQAPLKIVINGAYGISKSPTSKAYDPRNANLVCINGQLMIIDLIEKLEVIRGFELIQSNTDGLIIALPPSETAHLKDICAEWEDRCQMELEFDQINRIWQKDVNNYIFECSDGRLERKGAFVKELTTLDYDLPIVNKAVVAALVNNMPIEQTIMACDELKEFQMIRKIGKPYSHIVFGGYWEKYQAINPASGRLKTYLKRSGHERKLNEKCIRIFASNIKGDNSLWKVKRDGSLAKLEGTPEHCFINNNDINNLQTQKELDKNWYIDLAKSRLQAFQMR